MLHLLVCFLIFTLAFTDAFVVSPHLAIAKDPNGLSMTKRPTSRSNRPKKGKNYGNPKSAGRRNSPVAKEMPAFQMSPKQKRDHAPPWQVVRQKDMKKNVQAETERRRRAQDEGIHSTRDNIAVQKSRSFLSNHDNSILAWKRFILSPSDHVQFIGSYLDRRMPPRLGEPEVAFLGRSNVGKSSLLNRLLGSPTARVGKTPGATASVNLYSILRKDKNLLGLVDLPGFGYAKLSKESKESVEQAAENYLGKRKELMLGILLVDIRREPTADDRAVLAALYDMGVPIVVVATKTDKLPSTHVEKAQDVIRDSLGLPEGQPLCMSSVTGQGIKKLWNILMDACETGVAELRGDLELGGVEPEPLEVANLDEGEVAYSQGYDWIHEAESFQTNGPDSSSDDSSQTAELSDAEQPLRYLRKKVREMERRGEL